MRLKKLTLHNFRCFEKLEVDLHPRLTVIVGTNGAGKTAIMDGIAIGLGPVLRYLSSANQRLQGRGIEDKDFRVIRMPNSGADKWGVADATRVEVETFEGLAWDVWRGSRTGKKPEQLLGETALKHHLQAVADSYNTAEPQLTPVFAYFGASRGYIEVPERLRRSKVNYSYPAAALVDALDSYSNFREMLAWFDLEEAAELREQRDVEVPSRSGASALNAVRKAIGDLLSHEYSEPHFNRAHKFMMKRKADGAPLFVSQLSQGYQSMLAMAMDFARRSAIANSHYMDSGFHWEAERKALLDLLAPNTPSGDDALNKPELPLTTNYAPAIMLVDEIDLHLHPTWQQRVLSDLMRTFPLTQFIVTTHSPQVLTSVDKSSIRVLRQGSLGEWDGDEPRLDHVEYQTRGVASGDLLARIMGTSPVPHVPEAEWVDQYHAFIQEGRHQQLSGLELRKKLERHFGLNHPVIREMDRMIRLQEFKKRLPRDFGNK